MLVLVNKFKTKTVNLEEFLLKSCLRNQKLLVDGAYISTISLNYLFYQLLSKLIYLHESNVFILHLSIHHIVYNNYKSINNCFFFLRLFFVKSFANNCFLSFK